MKKIIKTLSIDVVPIAIVLFVSIMILKNILTIFDINSPFLFQYANQSNVTSMQLFALLIWLIPRVFLYIAIFRIFTKFYQDNFLYFRIREPRANQWVKLVSGSIGVILLSYEILYFALFVIFFKINVFEINIFTLGYHFLSFLLLFIFLILCSVIIYLYTNHSTQVINISLLIYICTNIIGLFSKDVSPILLVENSMPVSSVIILIALDIVLFEIFKRNLNIKEYYH